MLRDVALVYDWCSPLLTAQQRTRWEAYADQAVWNVWNYANASWGGNPFPWSGWSVDNPGNNYHYSFLEATMYWAFAADRQTWIDFLTDVKFPAVVAYFQGLPGGGSREGTGYGVSLGRPLRALPRSGRTRRRPMSISPRSRPISPTRSTTGSTPPCRPSTATLRSATWRASRTPGSTTTTATSFSRRAP